MSLVGFEELQVDKAMSHSFVFQLFTSTFLNFMFVELTPLSTEFLVICVIRFFSELARAAGLYADMLYFFQERVLCVRSDILKRPILTLYEDLRWAHQSIVCEIVSMSAVIVAISMEYVTCDSVSGMYRGGEGRSDFPVLTEGFDCEQKRTLLVTDFILFSCMIIALALGSSMWTYKFRLMRKDVLEALNRPEAAHFAQRMSNIRERGRSVGLGRKWTNIEGVKTTSPQIQGAPNVNTSKPANQNGDVSQEIEDREETSLFGLNEMQTMRIVEKAPEMPEGSILRRESTARATNMARKALRTQKTIVTKKGDEWNLNTTINDYYRSHMPAFVAATGYAISYAFWVVIDVKWSLSDVQANEGLASISQYGQRCTSTPAMGP